MTGLLDTHTLLWAIQDPWQLGTAARAFIEDRRNAVWVSAVSAYEISSKIRLGKLPEAEVLHREFEEALLEAGYASVTVTARIALRAGRLPSDHRDPFDRLIAATALESDILLLSKDTAMDSFGVQRVW